VKSHRINERPDRKRKEAPNEGLNSIGQSKIEKGRKRKLSATKNRHEKRSLISGEVGPSNDGLPVIRREGRCPSKGVTTITLSSKKKKKKG